MMADVTRGSFEVLDALSVRGAKLDIPGGNNGAS